MTYRQVKSVPGLEVTADADFAALLQSYVSQLELMQQREDRVPDHIDTMFQERYGFHFNKDKI